jgi:hypothetical protein
MDELRIIPCGNNAAGRQLICCPAGVAGNAQARQRSVVSFDRLRIAGFTNHHLAASGPLWHGFLVWRTEQVRIQTSSMTGDETGPLPNGLEIEFDGGRQLESDRANALAAISKDAMQRDFLPRCNEKASSRMRPCAVCSSHLYRAKFIPQLSVNRRSIVSQIPAMMLDLFKTKMGKVTCSISYSEQPQWLPLHTQSFRHPPRRWKAVVAETCPKLNP